MQPKLAVTGYRGIWGETLTEEIAIKFATAFGMFTKEESIHPALQAPLKRGIKILVGRDGRESGEAIKNAIIPELKKLGINVIDGSILPTPTMMFACNKHKYDGGIIITASHNPTKYNGLKFITKDARLTNESEVEKIKSFLDLNSPLEEYPQGEVDSAHPPRLSATPQEGNQTQLTKEHIDFILENINVEAIRARKFKVVADMINASACVVDPYLFEKLGVELVPLNNIPNGKFAHEPEPIKENLEELCALVKSSRSDIGFAHDPDADRLVIVDENGTYISEEYTLGFGIENILSKNPESNVVINMSTSQMSADITEKYNGKCFRTKVGESNVFAGIAKHNAIIGGEGGSGVILPKINNCRDGFVSLVLTLELLAERDQTVSELVNSLPKYFMKKDKWSVPSPQPSPEGRGSNTLDEIYKKLQEHFPTAISNTLDGLRLDFPDASWIHLRPSNTEPLIRLFGEAKTPERIDALFDEAKNLLF